METVRLLGAYVSIFVIPAPHRVRDKLQRESSFFALDPCFRRGDIVDFAEEFNKSFLGNSVTVARLTLDQLVQVRILVPQLGVCIILSDYLLFSAGIVKYSVEPGLSKVKNGP